MRRSAPTILHLRRHMPWRRGTSKTLSTRSATETSATQDAESLGMARHQNAAESHIRGCQRDSKTMQKIVTFSFPIIHFGCQQFELHPNVILGFAPGQDFFFKVSAIKAQSGDIHPHSLTSGFAMSSLETTLKKMEKP